MLSLQKQKNNGLILFFIYFYLFFFNFLFFFLSSGVGYHPSKPGESYPKTKQKCAMRFSNIAPERMLDPAAWYLFFNIKVTAKKENRPSMIYDVFLPFLNDGPIGEAVDRDIETSGWWESIQLAGTCYYRCILCSFRYLLKADGFSQTQQKQLFVQIRASFLQKIKDELTTENGTSDFRSSDVRMINMGCSQTLYAAMKLAKREGINSKGMLRLEALVNDVQALVDATPKLDSDKTELQVHVYYYYYFFLLFFFFSYFFCSCFQ